MFNCIKKFFRPRRQKASGEYVGRRRTRDISFLAQSPVGSIGDLTRSVPAPKVFPQVNDSTNPIVSFGLACQNTANNTVRTVLPADGSLTSIAGIAVRPFPFQVQSATNFGAQSFSNLTAAPSGLLGILKSGPMLVYCNSAQAPSATMQSPVNVWIVASTGTHIQGGFETAASATVASAPGANTGTGTLGTLSVTAGVAQNGAYTVKFTGATTFTVLDPNGKALANGTTGVAYNDGGVAFTITAGGTAFVAGDSFTVTVTNQTILLDNKSYFNGPGDSTGAIELAFNL
jgi:hypothetical protein